MPKAKPTQVLVHRIELQETERATLEAALAGKFVTNAVSAAGGVLTGMGAALAPFAGAISALAALWIADRTLDQILDAARESGERIKQQHEEEYHTQAGKHIGYFSAWLNANYENGGWPEICNLENVQDYLTGPDGVMMPFGLNSQPQFFIQRCMDFLNYVCAEDFDAMGQTPSELWAAWYTVEEYGRDAYYYSTNGSAVGGIWHTWKATPKGPLGKLLPKKWTPTGQGW